MSVPTIPTIPTIYALSSGEGRTGVAIIRISGPRALGVAATLTGRTLKPRLATRVAITAARDGELIDTGLAIAFPAPASFTGDDVVELHIHGSPAVLQRLLDELSRMQSLQLAEPGAFTRRAFENGKLDLTEVEGLADLIAADTEQQRRQALTNASGTLRHKGEAWRRALIQAAAHVEAGLDFSDEGDVSGEAITEAERIACTLRDEIAGALKGAAAAGIVRDGYRVVIAGPPNVGKSTLMNQLAGRDVAIVSEQAGTTRDVIEVRLDLAGLPVAIIDTAGLRDADGPVERAGVERAHREIANADLILVLHESAAAGGPAVGIPALATSADCIKVANKIDLVSPACRDAVTADHAISAETGDGIAGLLDDIADRVRAAAGTREPALVTRTRQRLELETCLAGLEDFITAGPGPELELRAEDLRIAAAALGRLTGRIDAEEVLGEIFAGFCIGK